MYPPASKQTESKRRAPMLAVGLYLAAYGALSASFLTRFPFVHSDEAWLAGLSRDMMAAGSPAATESFFVAKMRVPHALRILFHLLQEGAISLFGYSVSTVRLLSLFAGLLALVLFYLVARRLLGRHAPAFALMVLLSLDTSFFYLSHMARQEIWLLVLILGILLLVAVPRGAAPVKATVAPDRMAQADSSAAAIARQPSLLRAAGAAVLTGLAIGFHPTALLLACAAVCMLLTAAVQSLRAENATGSAFFSATGGAAPSSWRGRASLRHFLPLLLYLAITAAFAAVFVGLSYSFGPHFLPNYFAYGAADFGTDAAPGTRFLELLGFFSRLWKGQSGTYTIPQLKPYFVIFAAILIASIALGIRRRSREIARLLACAFGLVLGIYLVGRFNQLDFFLLVPVFFLLGANLLMLGTQATPEKLAAAAAFALVVGLSAWQIVPFLSGPTYEDYLAELAALVPSDAKVIANLNTEFYFDQGCLLDYRDLPYALREGTLEEYIEGNGVEYILYSTELDFLYEHSPYYNVIYGPVRFVPELRRVCEDAELVGSFTNTRYGSRVIAVMGQPEYSRVEVYKLSL